LQEFGDSVQQSIKSNRIETSAIELVASRKTVKEVAEEFGFSDASKYSRIFKQVTRISQRDFLSEEK
jgi:transcriptional regulator GlxA family with amidase domain